MLPSDLRALADHLDQQALDLARDGRPTEGALRMVEALRLREMAAEAERLTGGNKARKVRHMAQAAHAPTEGPTRTGPGRPRKSRHAFPAALEAKGLTVAEWARERKLERSVVRSWFADKPRDQRSVPLKEAEEIRRAYGVPFSAWPKGVRD